MAPAPQWLTPLALLAIAAIGCGSDGDEPDASAADGGQDPSELSETAKQVYRSSFTSVGGTTSEARCGIRFLVRRVGVDDLEDAQEELLTEGVGDSMQALSPEIDAARKRCDVVAARVPDRCFRGSPDEIIERVGKPPCRLPRDPD